MICENKHFHFHLPDLISAWMSNLDSGENLFGGAILDTRRFKRDMAVKSGENLVIGGIIQQETTDIVRKVMLLGDIPVLRYVFKKLDKVERDVKLMYSFAPSSHAVRKKSPGSSKKSKAKPQESRHGINSLRKLS